MEPVEEKGPEEEKQPPGKSSRPGVGKLFLVLAGGGALALVIFVLMPMLTEVPEPPPPPSPQEIVAEVMETSASETEDRAVEALPGMPAPSQGMGEDADRQSVIRVPSPLLAVRSNGEEPPLVFPQREPEGERDDDLPPPLSPEEIEAALPKATQPAESVQVVGRPVPEVFEDAAPETAVQPPAAASEESLEARAEGPPAESPALPVLERPVGAAPARVREVQGLLKELGYDPGPVDGVWGRRTTEAWKAFAREAGVLALALAAASVGELSGALMSPEDLEELKELEARWAAEQTSAPPESRPPPEAASPSEAPFPEATAGAVRAGNQHPDPPAEGVVMRGTLRGVMGYRMPLVSRQEVPDQVVSGVLIPAHTAFVILKPGYWELTGLDPDDVAYLREAAAGAEASEAKAHEPEPQPARRGWNPLRLFRRQAPVQGTK
ncbi:MAG: peptidoglycan-binding domain-containing protein [Candidatus Tectomicrobia bacterium]|nr:peptidoglycan-binding domain-containing protein [Candidatus Tectomicrobia bacterium]